jgi:PPK2 family polyphosphate:nucleotide phosphotransferase
MNTNRFRVKPGTRRPLKHHRPDDTGHFTSRDSAVDHLVAGIDRLRERQELLYAQDQYSLLLVFQGMDAAGKDSAITHVMSGASPLATDVHAFKAPSPDELNHDYLWRINRVLPARGRIGIFNRSHYEEVLTVRVHHQLLENEQLPPDRVTKNIWRERFEDINTFERHLTRNGTVIRKFFLHVSRQEQRKRLLKRLEDPSKRWKFSPSDLPERKRWHDYMAAYEDLLSATSTKAAPWYVIPADHKWFSHAAIAQIIVDTLDSLDLSFPKISPKRRRELARARRVLARTL